MNNKRTSVNLYKDIVLVTRVRIFCTTLFTNNNIKVVIQMNVSLMGLKIRLVCVDAYSCAATSTNSVVLSFLVKIIPALLQTLL